MVGDRPGYFRRPAMKAIGRHQQAAQPLMGTLAMEYPQD
jgi:hypothetical protein